MSKTKPTWKQGQYVACKYNGSSNGDLIVGRVHSVRKTGHIILQNLLTKTIATKLTRVVAQRNFLISRKDAIAISSAANPRAAAVSLYQSRTATAPPPQKPSTQKGKPSTDPLLGRVAKLERTVEAMRLTLERLFVEPIPV
jgi:hypothetical protein